METLKTILPVADEEAQSLIEEEDDEEEYVDWSKAERVTFPNLKTSVEEAALTQSRNKNG